MARRFTVIQGSLPEGAVPALPSRRRLEVLGAALRLRLADLPRSEAFDKAVRRPTPARRQPIPAQAFLGVRPVAAVA